jgi:hypothetical protein
VTDLVVIVPSRGRPQNIARLVDDWKQTGAWDDPHAHLVVAVDDDDPTLLDYVAVDKGVTIARWLGMVGTLNEQALRHAGWPGLGKPWCHVGFAGDDHAPRTPGWAERIRHELDEMGTGIVYGNDLFQRQNLPTAVFMTSDIIAGLGYMVPPTFRHLYADNVWKAWGEGIGRLRYLDDVVLEHLHPEAQKSEWDEHYIRVNSGQMYSEDGAAWEQYRDGGGLAADITKLKELL